MLHAYDTRNVDEVDKYAGWRMEDSGETSCTTRQWLKLHHYPTFLKLSCLSVSCLCLYVCMSVCLSVCAGNQTRSVILDMPLTVRIEKAFLDRFLVEYEKDTGGS